MIKKKLTYNKTKLDLLIVSPTSFPNISLELLNKDLEKIREMYSKSHNIISTNTNLRNVDGYYSGNDVKFETTIFLRYNIDKYRDIKITPLNFKLSLQVNHIKNYEDIYDDFIMLRNQMHSCQNIFQVMHNEKDFIIPNSKKLYFKHKDLIYKQIEDYMYWKYGMHNIPGVLYLKSNTIDELFTYVPFDNIKIPIEYKELIDIVQESYGELGSYVYINNII